MRYFQRILAGAALAMLLAGPAAAHLSQSAPPQESSAELLANLAEHHAAGGETGLAVLHYERALLLAPGRAELRAGLRQLRHDKGLLRNQPLPERLAGLLGADQWLLLSGAAFALLSLTTLAAGLLGRKRLPWACRCNAALLAAALLPLPAAWLRYQHWQDGVVLTEASLLLSPFAGAEPVGKVKEGELVRPAKEHGGYVLVQAESGGRGWLKQDGFQQITGPAAAKPPAPSPPR
ncbi:MAG: hypothetical protein ACTFAL_05155 [Candidatus Electronema sp. V4]|uniref:hypothetical protein n=1 Tax=Candidatus Electronema sp. V4 TaxID=3454756 RepID=UPI00405556DD